MIIVTGTGAWVYPESVPMTKSHFETAQQVIDTLKAVVEQHRNGAEPNDDLTMMCVRVK